MSNELGNIGYAIKAIREKYNIDEDVFFDKMYQLNEDSLRYSIFNDGNFKTLKKLGYNFDIANQKHKFYELEELSRILNSINDKDLKKQLIYNQFSLQELEDLINNFNEVYEYEDYLNLKQILSNTDIELIEQNADVIEIVIFPELLYSTDRIIKAIKKNKEVKHK